jgi:hypothetical protein
VALVRKTFVRLVPLLCFGALAVAGSPQARAQATATCEPILAAADERYIQREYDEAEALVRACLAQAGISTDEAIQAHRLLALIALRQDDLPGAELAITNLLAIAPDYAPDPVQDPPAYVDLVVVVEERLRTDPAAPPADPPVDIVQADPDDADGPLPPVVQTPPRERRGITRWLLIGGGVVVAGLAAVLVATGGSSSPPSGGGTPLPPPPPFPR